MPAGENPHSISEKKAALRESLKEPNDAINQQARTSYFPKDTAGATIGLKRPHHNGPMNQTNHHMLGNTGVNGHLVYVRRKLETDHSKGVTSGSAEIVSSLSAKRPVIGVSQEQSLKHQNSVPQTQAAPVSASAAAAIFSSLPSESLPAPLYFGKQSPGKVTVHPIIVVTADSPPRNVVSTTRSQNFVPEKIASCNVGATSAASHDAVATTTHSPTDLQRSSNQDWKERFIRLQAFLRNNEQSGKEEYISMLQSLSSVGRRKHAFELEKRAVNLLIEEGRELQKMKVLNVMGKLSPTDHPSVPTQPSLAMRLPFQPFPAHR